MIPPKSDPCWKALVTGQLQHQFKLASLAMCIARNQRQVKQNPAAADQGIEDIYSFCSKFEKLVESELQTAFNLERV
jgi:hypothetical protein